MRGRIRFRRRVALSLAGLFSLSICAAEKAPPVARLGGDAAVRLDRDEARLSFALHASGTVLETLNEMAEKVSPDASVTYRFVRSCREDVGAGRASVRVAGKTAVFSHDFTAHVPMNGWTPAFYLSFRAPAFAKAKWKTDDRDGVFPEKADHACIASGTLKSIAVTFPGGRIWTVSLPVPTKYDILDLRRENKNEFVVRMTLRKKVNLAFGKGDSAKCVISASDGAVQPGVRAPIGIYANDTWVRLAETGDIRSSSVLDFSRVPTRKAPAGLEGNLVATTNGDFRFSRSMNTPRRFFGCLVPNEKLFLRKEESTDYTKALARLGYNAIRLSGTHHKLLASRTDLDLDDKKCAGMDLLVTGARREGLYVMMDLVSSGNWTWNAIGLPPPGKDPPSARIVGSYFLADEKAFGTWKRYAEALFGRSNRSGRRKYAEDPTVPLVFAMDDLSLFDAWREIQLRPDMAKRYGAWLAEKRKTDSDFMKGRVSEQLDFAMMPLSEDKAASIRLFLAETEEAGLRRMKNTLKGLKSKALLGACQGSGRNREVLDTRTDLAGFVPDAIDLASARPMGMNWSAPYRYSDWNPLETGSPIHPSIGGREPLKKPVCLYSWHVGENTPWRSYTGLLVGAWAAKRGWDAVLRDRSPLGDPFTVATDRAVYSLFERGDFTDDRETDEFKFDRDSLVVRTPRTAGGFSMKPDGRIEAAPFAAKLSGSRATIWVMSLTDAPIAKSKRLLLTHLTERHREGTLFADSRYDLVLRRGTGAWHVRDGGATIELEAEKASSYKVFSLNTEGVRTGRIPVEVKGGLLSFTIRVRGNRGAQFLYELVRD